MDLNENSISVLHTTTYMYVHGAGTMYILSTMSHKKRTPKIWK